MDIRLSSSLESKAVIVGFKVNSKVTIMISHMGQIQDHFNRDKV